MDEETNDLIIQITKSLNERFGRFPTEDEVYGMIFGDEKDREDIWNKENNA